MDPVQDAEREGRRPWNKFQGYTLQSPPSGTGCVLKRFYRSDDVAKVVRRMRTSQGVALDFNRRASSFAPYILYGSNRRAASLSLCTLHWINRRVKPTETAHTLVVV